MYSSGIFEYVKKRKNAISLAMQVLSFLQSRNYDNFILGDIVYTKFTIRIKILDYNSIYEYTGVLLEIYDNDSFKFWFNSYTNIDDVNDIKEILFSKKLKRQIKLSKIID